MPHRSTIWGPRSRSALALAVALAAAAIPATVASASPWTPVAAESTVPETAATPRIVGGTVLADNSTAPYTVAIQTRFADGTFGGCSGTILDAVHVLTAAHCFVRDGVGVAPEAVRVGVGHHEIVSPAGRAAVTVLPVAALRVHPLYTSDVFTDDVAVVTLAIPLDFSAPRVAPLPLAPAGKVLPGNTPVRVTGFGASSATANDFGTLRSVNTRSQFSSLCGTDAPAVMLCTFRSGHAACKGDSGGTATIERGTQLIGVTNTAVRDCAAGLNLFANVAAPEIRTFIDAAIAEVTLTPDQIPIAPRGGRHVRISGTARAGRTVTCLRGKWAGIENSYRYRFVRFRGDRAQATPSSRKRTYRVRSGDRGWRISCAVEASNGGGSGIALGRTLRRVR
jgi:secreted trypsin-like serine protease